MGVLPVANFRIIGFAPSLRYRVVVVDLQGGPKAEEEHPTARIPKVGRSELVKR